MEVESLGIVASTRSETEKQAPPRRAWFRLRNVAPVAIDEWVVAVSCCGADGHELKSSRLTHGCERTATLRPGGYRFSFDSLPEGTTKVVAASAHASFVDGHTWDKESGLAVRE